MTSPSHDTRPGVSGATEPADDVNVERLGHFLDDLEIGMALLDRELRYRHVNHHLAALNGVPVADHLGRTIEDVVPDVAPSVRGHFEAAFAGAPRDGIPGHGSTLARPDGEHPWLYHLYRLEVDGEVLLLVVARDATLMRRAERERDEAEALLESLFANAPLGLGIFDSELRFDRLNEALAEINGVPVDAHLGQTVEELLPDMDPTVMRQMRHVLESGRPVRGTTATGRTPADPHRDRHWRVAYYPLDSGTGAPFGVGAIAEEITEEIELREAHDRLQQEIEQQRQLLEDVVRRTPAAIALVWGPEHRYRLVNDAYFDITPRRGDLLDQRVLDVFPEAGGAVALLDRVRESGRAIVQDDFAVPFDGPGSYRGHRFYRFTMDPIGDRDGPSQGVLMVAQEITSDVRRREQLVAELDFEREIVHQLQEALLPDRLPEVPGLTLAARYQPAGLDAALGGDFYDVFAVGDDGDDWVAVLGDVCGKGSKAAATTAMLRYTLRAEARHDARPAALLEALNLEAVTGLEAHGDIDILCTVFCVRLRARPTGWQVTVGSAGHPPAALRRASGEVELLSGRGPLIGLDRDARFEEQQATLGPGDMLVLYTDGVLEGQAPALILQPEDVAQTVGELPAEPAAVVDGIARLALGERPPRDDVAVLTLQVA